MTFSQFSLRTTVSKYGADLLVGKLSWLTTKFEAAKVLFAVSFGVGAISLVRVPSKVTQTAVQRITVIVTAFHSLGTGANKSFQHELVNKARASLIAASQIDGRVAISQIGFKQTGLAAKTFVRRARAFDLAQIADFVPVQALNRTPFFKFNLFGVKLLDSQYVNLRLGLLRG